MTTEPAWDVTRWRDGSSQAGHPGGRMDSSTTPLLSAPSAVKPILQSTLLGRHDYDRHRHDEIDRSQNASNLSAHSKISIERAYSYRSPFHDRHSPPPAASYGPQHLISTPPHASFTGRWRGPSENRQSNISPSDSPLTVQIPSIKDARKPSPAQAVRSSGGSTQGSLTQMPSQAGNSLPSFAAFQQHTNRADDSDVDEPEIAPMSSRLPCDTCTKLQPMVRDVAIALVELDQHVQSVCRKPAARALDSTNDNPVRVLEWIIDTMKSAKNDLQDALQRRPAAYHYQQTPLSDFATRPSSPPHPLKRPIDQWDHDDSALSKRQRGDTALDVSVRGLYNSHSRGDRQSSVDLTTSGPFRRTAYSPPLSESIPGSAYPRHGSPFLPGRPLKALPSPTSLAYPPSAAPSLPPPTAPSVGSPALSYQPSASVHTASTNSVTSAHLAELQHQVTLKSLAMETLQSEYTSLLQKLQRERLKSQTIEKKTVVADSEINDLTGKNEDLSEQVRSLETQVEELERRREAERAEAARDKEQWGRMLDMSGRLQTKQSYEFKKLLAENEALTKANAAHEEEQRYRRSLQLDKGRAGEAEAEAEAPSIASTMKAVGEDSMTSTVVAKASDDEASGTSEAQRENVQLRLRLHELEAVLTEVSRHNQDLQSSTGQLLQQSNILAAVVRKALDGASTTTQKADPDDARLLSLEAADQPTSSPKHLMNAYPALPSDCLPESGETSHSAISASAANGPAAHLSTPLNVSKDGNLVQTRCLEVGSIEHANGLTLEDPTRVLAHSSAPATALNFVPLPSFAAMGGQEMTPRCEGSSHQSETKSWLPAISEHSGATADAQSKHRTPVPPYHSVPSPYATQGRLQVQDSRPPLHMSRNSPGASLQDKASISTSPPSSKPQLDVHGQGAQHTDAIGRTSSPMAPPPKPSTAWHNTYADAVAAEKARSKT